MPSASDAADDQSENPEAAVPKDRRERGPLVEQEGYLRRRACQIVPLYQDQPQHHPDQPQSADDQKWRPPRTGPFQKSQNDERREDGAESGTALQDAVAQRALL